MRKLHAFFLIGLVTVVLGTVYGVAQQYGRSATNDVPITLAQNIVNQLDAGVSPSDLATSTTPESLTNSYSPFFVVYSRDMQPVAGSGYLNDQLAHPDNGVFMHTALSSYHTVTWQPGKGVRIASVETRTAQYYVLTGQSLALTEKRAGMLFGLVAFGWAISVLCIAVGYVLLQPKARRNNHKK